MKRLVGIIFLLVSCADTPPRYQCVPSQGMHYWDLYCPPGQVYDHGR